MDYQRIYDQIIDRAKKKPQKINKCPHCNREGGNSFSKWHFENCKFKNKGTQ